MRLAVTLAAVLLAGCASAPPPDAQAVLAQAQQTMGGAAVRTIAFTAKGSGGTFGQAWQPWLAWPGLNYSNLARTLDFQNGAFREDFARSRSEPNGGGATPLLGQGEARVTGFAREAFAWNAAGTGSAPSPVALEARIHDLWTSTPQGALQAAKLYDAVAGRRTVDGVAYTTLSFTVPQRLVATVYVDANGLVPRIDSRMPHPVAGDTEVVTTFAEWRDVQGLKFPGRIRQSAGGHPVLDVAVQDVKVDAPAGIEIPDNVRAAKENATAEKVADGVWFIAGGSHNSVAIELSDRILLVESPLYDGRAAAVFATANGLVPGKAVKTVVNSHHHFDHAGGLRYAAGEGATLVTSALAKPYFERVFANANTVKPDRLAASGRSASITGVAGKQVIADPLRTVEVHEMTGSVHAQGFLMVWLPKERLLIQADAYTPAPPNSPPPPVPNANQVNLVQNFERLGMQPERILPLHGRVVPVAELYASIGRK